MTSINFKPLLLGGFIVFIAIAACWYNETDFLHYVASPRNTDGGPGIVEGEDAVFTVEELKRFNGESDSRLYLAILGRVFDVSKGRQHYEPGATYHFFVGKDGSRSFITGDFSEESSADCEDVLDLSCSDLSNLQTWLETYHKQYTYKGKLVGRHYDAHGRDTEYRRSLTARLEGCEEERRAADREAAEYPPCNVEWIAGDGTRVWCTTNSGGVVRKWVGVPRRLLVPGGQSRCVCVETSRDNSHALLQPYPHCPPAATECTMLAS